MLSSTSKKETIKVLANMATQSSEAANSRLLSYLYARQLYLINPEDSVGLEKMATALFNIKDYSNALICVDKWFASASSDSEQNERANMFYIKALSLFHLRKYEHATENLRKSLTCFIQLRDEVKAAELRRLLEEELPRAREAPQAKPASQKREECVLVKKYTELNELPDVPDKMVYILPSEWLEKWKEFNNYYEFMGDENKRKDFMEDEGQKVEWLGPIDPTSVLADIPNLVDPAPEEMYTNFQIKQGLEENKDFYIISEEFWDQLYQRYGGTAVQRPTYRKSENYMTISVEVWLQKINILMLPLPKKEQPLELQTYDTIYISKRKTIKELREKLIRAYSCFFPHYDMKKVESRIWKVDPRFDLKQAWRRWDSRGSFEIHGSVLDETAIIEDAEISDDDTLIFELHYLQKSWFISLDDVTLKTQNQSKDDVVSLSSLKDFPKGSKKGLTGLQNLGNTCFMNSAIQCLSNTFDLTGFFITDSYKADVNKYNPLGSGGKLAYYYSELMKEMWLSSSSYVSPWELKKTIGKLASQFVGYGQQDSQELLSYLLDGLHEDLNRVRDKPFVEIKDDDDRPDELVAIETWNNHLKRNQSKIQELMHGQFKSRLDCPDCKKVSITFDPFMMLSLPIPTVEYTKFFLYFVYNSYERIPNKISFNMPSNTPYPEILQKISKVTKVPRKNIVMGLLKEHKLIEFVEPSADALYLKEHPAILFAYEIPNNTFSNPKGNADIEEAPNTSNDGSLLNGGGTSMSTSASNIRMDTENDEFNTALNESLVRVFILQEPKAFYESEKTASYTRLIRLDPSDTYRDIHIKIYERMRHHISKYFDKSNMKNPIKLDDRSKATLEKEYNTLFAEDNEGQWIYKVCMVNTSKEDPKTGKKIPCELCQKAKCARCALPTEEGRVSNYLQKMKIPPKEMLLEVRIIAKNIKTDNFNLNQCSEYRNEENDEANPNRNYNIYDCFNLFTRKEKLEKDNAWYCSKCKGHKEALKKMEIYKVPPVLIIHLKRFKTSKANSIGPFYWGSGKKLSIPVDFPLEGLDLTNYVLGDDRVGAIYDLFAVSNHYGGLSGGHYTAFAKNTLSGQWYDFNDSRVSSVQDKEIVGPAAYVLFYRRRDAGSGK